MLSRLRAKPGAEEVEAVLGDFASTRVDGEFSVVYLVFNTISNLTTQDAQVACFENAAAHLRLRSQHFYIVDGRLEAFPVELRYAWPAELDLMARLAGMRLQDRWAGWRREPFTAVSPAHVSVYERP